VPESDTEPNHASYSHASAVQPWGCRIPNGCDYFKSTKTTKWQIPITASRCPRSKTSPARMSTASSVRSLKFWPVSPPTSTRLMAARSPAFPTPSVALSRKWPFRLLRSPLLTSSPTSPSAVLVLRLTKLARPSISSAFRPFVVLALASASSRLVQHSRVHISKRRFRLRRPSSRSSTLIFAISS